MRLFRLMMVVAVVVVAGSGCGLKRGIISRIPVTITSEPTGAEVWTVPQVQQNKNYIFYTKGKGSVIKDWPSIKIGTTPFQGEIQLIGDHMRWQVECLDGSLGLVHAEDSSVGVILYSRTTVGLSLNCELRHGKEVNKINKRIASESQSLVLLGKPHPYGLTYLMWKGLAVSGVSEHVVFQNVASREMKIWEDDIVDKLKKLMKMREDELITEEEYEKKRNDLLEKY